MITVTFLNGCILATAEQSLWQYSYNQQLQINGLELPGVFTVDFCNEGDTTTVAMIGSSGVVDIPNELLTSGRAIVAYVFQKSTLTGGITRCEIRIDVLTRPERDDETPTPEQEAVIDQYIAELNEGVETAETAAANAETSENNAAASAADAQQSKADAAASASAAAGSASDASNSAAAAAQSAVNASNSAEDAAEAASEGIGYKEDSEAWAIGKRGGVDVGSSDETYHNNSKYYASQAAASSSDANSEAAAAAQSARDAAASANGAAQSAASATASKNAATNSADVAANAATAAQNHAISAASSATAASGSATAAANKATAAAQSATAAGNSATEAATAREAAEDAQDAAEAAAQSIAQSAAQIAQNTSDIGDLTSQINTLQPAATAADIGKALIVKTVSGGKPTSYEYGEAGGGGDASNYAPIIINSASGDIASFADGADGLPVKALSVNVEPIQDLHGYDSPWPAGGGTNIFPNSLAETKTLNGITIVSDGMGKYTISGTANGYGSIIFDLINEFTIPTSIGAGGSGCLYLNNSFVADANEFIPLFMYDDIKADSWTLSSTNRVSSTYSAMGGKQCNKIRFDFYAGASISGTIAPMISNDGSTNYAYAPYSNICPISGRTSASVTRTGKNLLNDVNPTVLNAYFVNGSTVSSENLYQRMVVIPCVPSTAYTFTWNRVAISGTQNARVCGFTSEPTYGSSGSLLAASVAETGSATFTTGANDHYIAIHMGDIRTTDIQASISASMLELNSTATAYEPYQGNTYTIQLGDTVYGGTLDVTGGKMVVDRATVDFGTLNWSKTSSTQGVAMMLAYPTGITTGLIGVNSLACSAYNSIPCINAGVASDTIFPNNSVCQSSGGASIRVRDDSYTDVASFKAAMSGVQLVYPLATPIEITLTPTQITTLLGTNNIWSDAGDVSVDYRADTKLYIDNIHQPTDDDMTADAQIASGKYFLFGGNLYKATTVIPAGDTIIPGTNCVQTNLAEALNALNT